MIRRSQVVRDERTPPVDCVFATSVLSTTRMLSAFYWARSRGHNRPLILLDFWCAPLDADSWERMSGRLLDLHRERRARAPRPVGVWIEGETLAKQALYSGLPAVAVPAHLERSESWHSICQSAAGFLSRKEIAYTRRAQRAMEERPFLNAAGVYAGPRTDDPLVPAFLYGIVIGLDEVLARDPHPKPPLKSSQGR